MGDGTDNNNGLLLVELKQMRSEISGLTEKVGGLSAGVSTQNTQIAQLFNLQRQMAESGCAQGRLNGLRLDAQESRLREHAEEHARHRECLSKLKKDSHPPSDRPQRIRQEVGTAAAGGGAVSVLWLIWKGIEWLINLHSNGGGGSLPPSP